jgi:hypothetical protein
MYDRCLHCSRTRTLVARHDLYAGPLLPWGFVARGSTASRSACAPTLPGCVDREATAHEIAIGTDASAGVTDGISGVPFANGIAVIVAGLAGRHNQRRVTCLFPRRNDSAIHAEAAASET